MLRYLGILVCLFLSACVSLSKQQQTENLMPPPSVDTSLQNSLRTPYFSVGDWPKENWWEVFGSEQLSSLMAIAMKNNPSIEAVEKRISFARETAKVARAKLFPLLTFDVTDSWQHLSKYGLYKAFNPSLPTNAKLIDITLSFNYEFDFWGKHRNIFLAALGRAMAEEAESAQVNLIVTTGVAQAYFALKTNLLKERLYQKIYEVRKNIFELETLMQKEALFSKLTPLLSEELALEAAKNVSSIQEEIAIDRHLINILMGRSPDEPIEIDNTLTPLPPSIVLPCSLSLDLLARRPDLMAQIWRVEALAHDVGAAKAEFYPNINLAAFFGYESTIFSKLFRASTGTAGVTPALHLPVFTAGAIQANINAKKALFDDAVFEYNNLLLKSAQEVTDLLAIAKSVYERKEEQAGIVASSQKRLDITQDRRRSGLDSALTEYAFQLEVLQKELDNVDLLYGQYLAVIKLIKSLGGGYTSEKVPLHAEEGK